ncbi:putative mucin [Golovinomyces cichoracearum]|uniref:Putative mucin n=1 Tax=Golovinomyces cichoracearum TaxID=62708 RepID=A0A420J9F9_9PEZI|nr:putative mucin [Golovinomyces cichoracearum]
MIIGAGVAMMPYNTRRKLLSLPSLGIHLPGTHASRANLIQLSPPSAATNLEIHPPKKLKRSHEIRSPRSIIQTAKRMPATHENTPPPSPKAEHNENEDRFSPQSIDFDGIKDEIVEAVILQLQKTGNRPHLVKELAVILGGSLKIVEQSANPSAIVSSRLSAYIKRPWSSAAPCPIAKELEMAHPRRTHYYLTIYPHRPISNSSSREYVSRAIISPSISSTASRCDENDADRRRELSPSPEIDLSSPEYDDEDQNFPKLSSIHRFFGPVNRVPRNQRSTSPPLEKDEKEFTQTARGMQKRKFGDVLVNGIPSQMDDHPAKSPDCDPLFGRQFMLPHNVMFLSSPITKSSIIRRNFEDLSDSWKRTDGDWDTRNPEHVELEEIDGMFDDL